MPNPENNEEDNMKYVRDKLEEKGLEEDVHASATARLFGFLVSVGEYEHADEVLEAFFNDRGE